MSDFNSKAAVFSMSDASASKTILVFADKGIPKTAMATPASIQATENISDRTLNTFTKLILFY